MRLNPTEERIDYMSIEEAIEFLRPAIEHAKEHDHRLVIWADYDGSNYMGCDEARWTWGDDACEFRLNCPDEALLAVMLWAVDGWSIDA